MKRSRWPLGVLFSVGLFVLVGVLAWLQYRWLGEVSEAERARLQSSLKLRAGEFADDFDREITRAYLSFQIDEASLASGPAAFAARYDRWQKESRAPRLVRAVYLTRSSAPDQIQEYRPDTRAFASVPWPQELSAVRKRVVPATTITSSGASTMLTFLRDPIVSSVPALVLAVPGGTFITHPADQMIVVVFDRPYLETAFLPSLVARYFPEEGADTYRFAVIDAGHPANAVFSRGVPAGTSISARQADATVPLFAFRFELLDQLTSTKTTGAAAQMVATAPRTTIVRGGSVSVTTTHEPQFRVLTPGVDSRSRAAASGNQGYSIYVEQRTTSTGVRAGGAAAVGGGIHQTRDRPDRAGPSDDDAGRLAACAAAPRGVARGRGRPGPAAEPDAELRHACPAVRERRFDRRQCATLAAARRPADGFRRDGLA